MSLLQRVAKSDKDPQRTIAALRLIIAHLERVLNQRPPVPTPKRTETPTKEELNSWTS
jgi:hypothetical protein